MAHHKGARKAANEAIINHIGNVLAVVSDKKEQTDGAMWSAVVVSAQDYYPFGMVMPGRSTDAKHRYGFNGKETDPETGIQDYGMRWYLPNIARFPSVDPLTASYPWYTPYQFAGNAPILYQDVEGAYKYPPGADYSKFTRLTTFLQKGIGKLLENESVKNGLKLMGGYSDAQLKQLATFGEQGLLTVEVTQLWKGGPEPNEVNGYTPNPQEFKLQLDIDLVNQLENASEEDLPAALFAVATTLLHETVHNGVNKNPMPNQADPQQRKKAIGGIGKWYRLLTTDELEALPDHQRRNEPPRWFYYRNKIKMGDSKEDGKAFESAVFYNVYEKGNGEALAKGGTMQKQGKGAINLFKELIEVLKVKEPDLVPTLK